MKTRLQKLMLSEHLTAAKLAEIAGVQPSTVSHILSGRNYPSFDFIANLLKSYPSLNPRWLLLGEGDMNDAQNPDLNTIEPQKTGADRDNDRDNNQPAAAELFTNDDPKITIAPVSESFDADTQMNKQDVSIENQKDKKNEPEPINHYEIAEKIVIFYSNGTFSMYHNK